MEELNKLANTIAELPGVESANVWQKGDAEARIYVDLTKHDGGKLWNGGIGHTAIVYADGRVELDRANTWAGAATRRRHLELGTITAISRAAREALES